MRKTLRIIPFVNLALIVSDFTLSFITNILEMARLDNNMVKAKFETIELGAMIRDCLGRIESRLHGCSVTIKTHAPVEVVTDNVLFGRAISLVLDNAVKYGGIPLVIEIEYGREENNFAFISIHDNGRGIHEAQLENIFSKYTRFAKEDQQNAGTGLGLAINKAIMKLLGGEITAANDIAGGATFTIRVPSAIPKEALAASAL